MELLIPGLAIVALMVWASTRIKRNAAAAFEAEVVETDDFVIRKPDGFLNNLNGDPANLAELYSKEFGEASINIRAGRVKLTRTQGTNIDRVAAEIKNAAKAVDDISEMIGGKRYRLIETAGATEGGEAVVTHKLCERNGTVYHLEATRLAETSDEFKARLDALVAGFELK